MCESFALERMVAVVNAMSLSVPGRRQGVRGRVWGVGSGV